MEVGPRIVMISDGNTRLLDKPLISVIVPNYMHEKYLRRRLFSIVQQTYQRIEIILLDDASLDNSKELLKEFASTCEKVTKLDVNIVNSGLPIQQWIKGISLARGDYIWIAESDDEADPGFLSTMLKLFDKHPTIGMAYCDSEVIDENSQVISQYDYTSPRYADKALWTDDFFENGTNFVINFMTHRNVIPNVSAVLFKSEVLRANLLPSSVKFCADWILYTKILRSCDIAFSGIAMNKFRKHIQTTRWHDRKSYSLELREKFSFLRALKREFASNELAQKNIDTSLSFIFENRHKYKRVSYLCDQLNAIVKSGFEQVYIFGANDIAEHVVDKSLELGMPPIVIDNFKEGESCKGIEIVTIEGCEFNDRSVVVICSLRHHKAMREQLLKYGFKGHVVRV